MELDVEIDEAAHEILAGIMAEHELGTISTFTRYRGKNPRRWLGQLYPAAFNPRFFGAFFPDGNTNPYLHIVTCRYRGRWHQRP